MPQFEPKPFGKYFLTEKIAIGGMAEIYKAKTFGVDGFEKLLAIKKILPHYSADKEFIAMLTDEAKLVVRLSHTNIVQIYDLGKVGDDYYISMEFIDGVNLREVINRGREHKEKIPLPVCLYVASEICKGLDYAHGKRDDQGEPLHIVHRDISPQNILISFEGETKIVDFGIAKAAMNVSHTTDGILKGKVTYMSPEQALGLPVDAHTDLFSVGILLFEMVTSERLFSGESQLEILKKIRSTQITEETLKDKIPADLRPILAKALAHNPKERFETAGDFQIALTKMLYSRYSDFSPKSLASLIKKWFAPELKLRKKKAQEEASISAGTRQALGQPKGETLVHAEGLEDEDGALMQDTTRPEDDLKPYHFVDTAKPEDEIKPQNLKPEDKEKNHAAPDQRRISGSRFLGWLFAVTLFLALIFSGIYYFKHVLPQREQEAASESVKEAPAQTVTLPAQPANSPPEVPVKGSAIIGSIPEGARIYLDGGDTKMATPATLEHLLLNQKYEVTLKKENYEDLQTELILTSSAPLTMNLHLHPVPPKSEPVQEKPEPAPEEKELPQTGLKLQETKKEVPASEKKSVPEPAKEPVKKQVQARETKQEKIKPPPRKAAEPEIAKPAKTSPIGATSLRIDSTPRGASVILNGQKSGITPVVLGNLNRSTSYTIRLSLPGYQSWSRTVRLTQSQLEIRAQMQKE